VLNAVVRGTSSQNEVGLSNELRPALKPMKDYTVREAQLDEELWVSDEPSLTLCILLELCLARLPPEWDHVLLCIMWVEVLWPKIISTFALDSERTGNENFNYEILKKSNL
jgi:hypothetical protein